MRALLAPILLLALAGPARGEEEPTLPPSAATPKARLLVLDVTSSDLARSQGETLTTFLAARASRFATLEVISSADMRELIALEGEKQQAGCAEDSASCLAELAGALDADLVLSTRAGKLDAVYVVTVQLLDARKAKAVGRASVEAWALDELPAKLGPALDELLANATGTRPVEDAGSRVSTSPSPLPSSLRGPLLLGGGVSAGLGAVLVGVGILPSLLYGKSKRELSQATGAFTGTDEQVTAAAELRASALEQRALYNGVGRWLALGGGLLVVGGAASLAGGFFLTPPAGEAP